MRSVLISPKDIVTSPQLTRSKSNKQFEERLEASIEEIGLAEPLKVAKLPSGKYLIVDGVLRWNAIAAIRRRKRSEFETVPAYVVDYAKRFEIRFQTDIYQDLLPSQLAVLVEHLHKAEGVRKGEIARYIGVSPPTLRNYTGLWRLLQRGGLLASVVDLMDVGVFPSSNPYAWLRLTAAGVRHVIERNVADGRRAETWVEECLVAARRGDVMSFPIKYIEAVTSGLDASLYREGEAVRTLKKELGLRRAAALEDRGVADSRVARKHLSEVARRSREPVLRSAAESLLAYLR